MTIQSTPSATAISVMLGLSSVTHMPNAVSPSASLPFSRLMADVFILQSLNDLLSSFHGLPCDLIRPGKRGNSCVFHDHVEMKRNRATRLCLPASCACDGVATSMIKTGRVHANVKFRLVISE